MLEIPVIRWGKEYESMTKMDVVHFETGETLARVHEANGGLIKMDMKKAKKAREILRQFSIQELVDKCAVAGELYDCRWVMGSRIRTASATCSQRRRDFPSTCAVST